MNLPVNFKFPDELIEILKSEPVFYPAPWSFTYEFPEFAQAHLEYVRKQYPDRSLIPFANKSYNDDFACFDGNDFSGDPKVYIIHFFASPGWEQRGSFENFDAWLDFAKAESEEYIRSMAEDDNLADNDN